MPKKKKKGAEKEKKAKKKPCVNERETVSFEQQILDNNRQLARLRSRNEYLEGEVEVLQTKLSQLEDDRSDVVAHLKRILQQKTEESRELSDRLLAMEELRKEEQIAYKKKEDSMEMEYHTMETNLSAEVKLAAGKLAALEDWRLARIDLMRKFEIQEEQMAEQEKRHEEALYEAEKSMIIEKAKMQKEMEDRLNDLAQSFREATNIRIADATHRAVRENVALNLELDAMYRVCRELDGKMKEYKEKERNLRLQASLFQSEAQMALNKLLEQNRLIDNLAEDHFNMSLAHGKICREEANVAPKEKMIQDYREQSVEAQKKARILEQNIEQTKKDTEIMLREMQDNCREAKRLGDLLNAAKQYIEKIAQLQQRAPPDTVCTCYHDFEDKLYVLMDILKQQEISRISGAEDSQPMEGEYSDRSIRSLANDSISSIMKIRSEQKTEVIKEENVQKAIEKSEETSPVQNIPSCLLSDSQSSDLTSPKETESPRSTDSED